MGGSSDRGIPELRGKFEPALWNFVCDLMFRVAGVAGQNLKK